MNPTYVIEVLDSVAFINLFNKLKKDSRDATESSAFLNSEDGTVEIYESKGDNVVDFLDHVLDQTGGQYVGWIW